MGGKSKILLTLLRVVGNGSSIVGIDLLGALTVGSSKFFLSDFSLKSDINFLREYLAIYWMKSLDEIAQLLSNSRWYRSILDESTYIWMNKCTFIYNLDEGGSYTPIKIAFCTT
jgi:hypothetical protein